MLPPIANNFVAGEDAETALSHVTTLKQHSVGGILNLLGEHHHSQITAAEDMAAYLVVIDAIGRSSLQCSVSVKPSQIGLDVSEDCFRENLASITERASLHNVFVWIDMEDHTTTDTTLKAYADHSADYERVGVCVQANLQRTPEDLQWLAEYPGKVRLVKGAYDEPTNIAYQQKDRVDEAYQHCLEVMFEQFDDGIAVGSHDLQMVKNAIDLNEIHGTDFEIQMLMGVREQVQFELASEYDVYQYIPYGDRWLSYFYRRMRERKENVLFALRAIVG